MRPSRRSRATVSIRHLLGAAVPAAGLLTVAAGMAPPCSAGTIRFTRAPLPAGLVHSYRSPGYYGPGVAAVDFDDDGDLDLFVCNQNEGNQLLLNGGDGTFADVAPQYGLNFVAELPPEALRAHPTEPDAYEMMPAFIDTDNDGDKDLLITGWNAFTRFFENVEGTFVDRTQSSGLDHVGHSTTAAVADFNRDGLLDLFIADWGGLSHLYRNAGANVWHDDSQSAGIYTGLGADPLPTWCAMWGYYDDDLAPDLFTGNDYGLPNLLYVNDGDGRFEERTTAAFPELVDPERSVLDGNATMGQAFGDFDHDGDFDLFVANSGMKDLYRRDGPVFVNLMKDPASVGPGGPLTALRDDNISWFCDWPDLDNDGWVDLIAVNGFIGHCPESGGDLACAALGSTHQRDRCWRNDGDGSFTDVTETSGFNDPGWGRGCAVADFDRDGDLDLFVTNNGGLEYPSQHSYFRNDSSGQGHWLGVRLVGVQSNRDGLGARLRARAGGLVHLRDKIASAGFISQTNDEVHFGLGPDAVVQELRVTWPSGTVDVWLDVRADQHLKLVEGSSPQAPRLPSIEQATATPERDGIQVAWEVDGSQAWTGFRIYRQGLEGIGGTIAEIPAEAGRARYAFFDGDVEPGRTYTYRVSGNQQETWVEAAAVTAQAPPRLGRLAMSSPAPNPFNPGTQLSLWAPAGSSATLRIVDALGREVSRVSISGSGAWQQLRWDGTDQQGRPVASGTYRAVLSGQGEVATVALTLVR